jgi:hypothetical protein
VPLAKRSDVSLIFSLLIYGTSVPVRMVLYTPDENEDGIHAIKNSMVRWLITQPKGTQIELGRHGKGSKPRYL